MICHIGYLFFIINFVRYKYKVYKFILLPMIRKFTFNFYIVILLWLLSLSAKAEVTITEVQGWLESGYVKWSPEEGQSYDVYIRPDGGSYTRLDKELLRDYGSYYRADALGLSQGNYQFKIVAGDGTTKESDVFTVYPYDRSGFAHQDWSEGVGAYNNDGTLKQNARVLYVYAGNAKNVSLDMMTSSSKSETRTGLQDILQAYEKGAETRPLAVRVIGKLSYDDMDYLGSSEEGLQVKGKSGSIKMNVTVEGVGDDATIYGFGFLVRNACSVEFRNFAVMLCLDDCMSVDTNNQHIWIHNLDFFYGQPGSDSDQKKGDGTVDIKGKSSFVTVSYNHFFDSGKCSLGGMKSETTDCVMTYHHNWFDHSDSRHPRIRTMTFHIYNNYFDGISKYGVGVTTGASAFVENNYFGYCRYPMLSSLQGSDIYNKSKGTFSSEDGGVIKSFGNRLTSYERYVYVTKDNYASTTGDWDAYEAATRDEVVPAELLCKVGETYYNNFDTNGTLTYSYTPDAADDVPAIVTGALGAGRMNHGDFKWTFTSSDDTSDAINEELDAAIKSYKSSLVGFVDSSLDDSGNSGDDTGDDTGGETGDDTGSDTGSDEQITETSICHFLNKAPSVSYVTVSGNYSDSKGTITYNGTEYSICLKIESKTQVTITPPNNCTVILYFDGAGKKLYLDGKQYTTDSNNLFSFEAVGGTTYTLTKGDVTNLFLIVFQPSATYINNVSWKPNKSNGLTYNLSGRITNPNSSGVVIKNNKKYLNP